MTESHRIVVLGAGYAGLMTAKRAARLLRRTNATVTLVNASDRFVERVRLHQMATDQRLRDLPLSELLDRTTVRLVVARAIGIDPDSGTVWLDREPHALGYDTLVYAVGSGTDVDTVPGVREHAFGVATRPEAERLRRRLPDMSTVLVIGGGLTGIETATEIAEARADTTVTLITSEQLAPTLSERARHHLRTVFARWGIRLRENTTVERVGQHGVRLADGTWLNADGVLWTAGFAVPDLARSAGFATVDDGRMVVDRTLRSTSHPNVFGVGDAALVRGVTRMSCQTGLSLGRYVGGAVAAYVTDRPVRNASPRYVWTNISLGRHEGLLQFTRADDRPRDLILTGRVPAWFKELVTLGTVCWLRSAR